MLSTLSREVPDVFEEVVLHQEGGSYLSHVIQLLRTSAVERGGDGGREKDGKSYEYE